MPKSLIGVKRYTQMASHHKEHESDKGLAVIGGSSSYQEALWSFRQFRPLIFFSR